MKLLEICSWLDAEVPIAFQEGYDNSGLQAGDPDKEIRKAMIALDVTESTVDEAVAKGCNMIISHHPLIFNPIKKLTGNNSTERTLIKVVKNGIAVYSCHTNLDIFGEGVSRRMAAKIGLHNVTVLSPLKSHLLKLVTYVPEEHIDTVRNAVFNAGAGTIGNYDMCSYNIEGTGSFRGNPDTKPFKGEKGELHFEKEIRFETIMLAHLRNKVIKALVETHPYEEVAYDIYRLENDYFQAGLGCVGELKKDVDEMQFLKNLSSIFKAKGIRYSKPIGKKIRKVAVCGGAGIGLLKEAIKSGADIFITADLKYHDFFNAENKILMADIGHFESEIFSGEILYELIIKKFPTFAVQFSETNTNPINYL
jgi:dinuclear metal center YbgI/SA1388 family protein